jgi:folylpolyglutamate synthase
MPFHHALFAPGLSSYSNVVIDLAAKNNGKDDLSWQLMIQKIWENLIQSQREGKI